MVKLIKIFWHTDNFTFSVAEFKLNGLICLLSVVHFLTRSPVREYSSITYSSHVVFHEIDEMFAITDNSIAFGKGSKEKTLAVIICYI